MEGVNELQNEKKQFPSSAEEGWPKAGVVLVKKFDGIWPTPPRLRVLRKLRDFYSVSRIHPSSAEEGSFDGLLIHSHLRWPRLQGESGLSVVSDPRRTAAILRDESVYMRQRDADFAVRGHRCRIRRGAESRA